MVTFTQMIFNWLNNAYCLTMVKSRKEHPSTVFYYGRNGLAGHLQIYLIIMCKSIVPCLLFSFNRSRP